MIQDVRQSYFYFENIDSGDKHFIFKKNILRFRISKTGEEDKFRFLTFTMRDGEKVSFFLAKDNADRFIHDLPNPDKVFIVDSPEQRDVQVE